MKGPDKPVVADGIAFAQVILGGKGLVQGKESPVHQRRQSKVQPVGTSDGVEPPGGIAGKDKAPLFLFLRQNGGMGRLRCLPRLRPAAGREGQQCGQSQAETAYSFSHAPFPFIGWLQSESSLLRQKRIVRPAYQTPKGPAGYPPSYKIPIDHVIFIYLFLLPVIVSLFTFWFQSSRNQRLLVSCLQNCSS